jgi:NADPH:quinone reductase-like Zn-dependent oxidoreductase
MTWILMAFGTSLGHLASIVVAFLTGRRIARAMRSAETSLTDVVLIAGRGLGSAALQLASALCRHYWPLALVAATMSRHFRRVVLVAAVLDGVVDWLRRRDGTSDDVEPIGLLTYLLLKRVDDLAYGLGLWCGVVRERNVRALKPQIRS